MRADKNPSFLIVEVVEVVFFIVGLLVELNFDCDGDCIFNGRGV